MDIVFSNKVANYYQRILKVVEQDHQNYMDFLLGNRPKKEGRDGLEGMRPAEFNRKVPVPAKVHLEEMIQAQLEAAHVLSSRSDSPDRIYYTPDIKRSFSDMTEKDAEEADKWVEPEVRTFVNRFVADEHLPVFPGHNMTTANVNKMLFNMVRFPYYLLKYIDAKERNARTKASSVHEGKARQDAKDIEHDPLNALNEEARALLSKDGRRAWYAKIAVDEAYDVKTRIQAVKAIGKTYGDEVEKLIVSGNTSNKIEISFAGGWMPNRLLDKGEDPNIIDVEATEVKELEDTPVQ